MTAESVLRCEGVRKRFGRTTALRSVSFSLSAGEFLTVFGRNGAGKSTLLGIVATLVRSYDGEVYLFGSKLNGAGEETRRLLSLLSHDSFLYADLTAFENLVFYARLYGLDHPARVAAAMLARIDLEEKSHAVTHELSRGMQQRLSLGRAFLHSPSLLLLDEPYAGLDETSGDRLDTMLTEFVAGGGAVLMATHDIERGFRHADRVAVLEGGRIVFEAQTRDTGMAEFRERYRDILST